MVPFESLSTVSYSHCIVTAAVSLAVLTQHTNVTDTAWQQELPLHSLARRRPAAKYDEYNLPTYLTL